MLKVGHTRGVVGMKHAIEAIYENGLFRPVEREGIALAEGQRVRITVDDQCEPEALRLALTVYEGLSENDIEAIEEIALDRGSFFDPGSRQ
jgi:predicted DNA-binding antitoxin AbrB/MazE fold protein